jgi:hypothetical protein
VIAITAAGEHFTISKARSWSPVSIKVLELAQSLPGGHIVSLVLQDVGYDRRLLKHGLYSPARRCVRRTYRKYIRSNGHSPERPPLLGRALLRFVDDQTLKPEPLAQIQCIVRKAALP